MQAIVRPWRLSFVVNSLAREGIRGMTAQNVRGVGVQGGTLRQHTSTAPRWAAYPDKRVEHGKQRQKPTQHK